MLRSKSDPLWAALVKGELKANFKTMSGNMILSRIARQLAKDNSAINLTHCVNEAYDFFARFETIFQDELNQIMR